LSSKNAMTNAFITYTKHNGSQKITSHLNTNQPLTDLVTLIETHNPYEATLYAHGIKLGEYASQEKNTTQLIENNFEETQYYNGHLIRYKPGTLTLDFLHRKHLTKHSMVLPHIRKRLTQKNITLLEDLACTTPRTPQPRKQDDDKDDTHLYAFSGHEREKPELTPQTIVLIAAALYKYFTQEE